MEYEITFHDSKSQESTSINDNGSKEDIVKTLFYAITAAKQFGYCRVTLEVTLES